MTSLHPIVQAYAKTSDSFESIFEKYYNADQFLEKVFFELLKNKGQDIKQDLLEQIDKAIIIGHPDLNIFLLFISHCILPFSRKHFEKARSLCSIGRSLPLAEVLPSIRALFTQMQGVLSFNEGNTKECMDLLNESSTYIDKADTRYPDILINTSFIIAGQAKLKEYGKYNLDDLNCLSRNEQLVAYTHLKIVNSILTCNIQDCSVLIEEYSKLLKGKSPNEIKLLNNYVKLISGDFNETNYQEDGIKCIAKAFHDLSMGKTEESKINYRQFISRVRGTNLLSMCASFIPIHIEICQGNKGMAKLLLQEKIKKGDSSYFDDLFFGRLKLIENDWEGADFFFSRLVENVARYDARQRLYFELQFAKEMKISVINDLLNGWKTKRTSSEIKLIDDEVKNDEVKNDEPYNKGIKLLVGKSIVLNQVKDLVRKYSKLRAPVLIRGETGTGKELVSRAIHDEGLYPDEPFLAINCGALTDTLLQSELFGYEAGAFTGALKQRMGIFEAAGKGTVFLDEFGDISPKLQVSLLRVLESNEIRLIGSTSSRKIECKIVIATNVDLQIAIQSKKFREDLYFRLAKFEIKLPSLRERTEDLPELIQFFLDKNSNFQGSKKITSSLIEKLKQYHWPGNIRELKNEIDRLYILNPDVDLLDVKHFDFTHLQGTHVSEFNAPVKESTVFNDSQSLAVKEDPMLKILQKGFPVETRHNLIKDLFKKYKKLTRSQIMEIANISTTTATKDLLALTNSGFIVRRTPTKSTRTDYFEIVN